MKLRRNASSHLPTRPPASACRGSPPHACCVPRRAPPVRGASSRSAAGACCCASDGPERPSRARASEKQQTAGSICRQGSTASRCRRCPRPHAAACLVPPALPQPPSSVPQGKFTQSVQRWVVLRRQRREVNPESSRRGRSASVNHRWQGIRGMEVRTDPGGARTEILSLECGARRRPAARRRAARGRPRQSVVQEAAEASIEHSAVCDRRKRQAASSRGEGRERGQRVAHLEGQCWLRLATLAWVVGADAGRTAALTEGGSRAGLRARGRRCAGADQAAWGARRKNMDGGGKP